MSGLTSTGFEIPTTTELVAAMEAQERATIDPTLDTSPESVIGNLNAIAATKDRQLWELALALYDARSPRNAMGAALDDLSAITGTLRKAATKGTVTLRVTLGAGVTLPLGSAAAVVTDSTNRWVTVAAATNTSGGPAQVDVPAEAANPGAVQAYSGTITVLATPHSGWTAVTNVLDAVPGHDAETDAALRLRRESEIQGAGAGTNGNLRAALSRVPSVTQAVVFENDLDVTDADGLPPHSLEALVLGGDTTAILKTIWARKPCGIRAFGSTSGTVTDASGQSRVVAFTRPSDVAVYLGLIVGVKRDTYAGDAAVRAALLTWGDSLLAGDPVRLAKVIELVMLVPGVIDCLAVAGLGWGSLYPLNLSATLRQRLVLDSARIAITVVS